MDPVAHAYLPDTFHGYDAALGASVSGRVRVYVSASNSTPPSEQSSGGLATAPRRDFGHLHLRRGIRRTSRGASRAPWCGASLTTSCQ